MTANDQLHNESAWQKSFTLEEREEQLRIDSAAWNGIIGILMGIAFMGVALGVITVLAIFFLT